MRGCALLILMLLVPGLAGCLGADETPDRASEDTTDGVDADADGTPDADGEARDDGIDTTADEDQKGPEPITVVENGEGLTSQGAWFCTGDDGTAGCQGQEVSDTRYVVAFAFTGTLRDVTFEVVWDALDPTLETMVVRSGVQTQGDGVPEGRIMEASSPVKVGYEGLEAGPDGAVFVAIWPAAVAKTPAGAAFVDVQRQPFDVTATITTIDTTT